MTLMIQITIRIVAFENDNSSNDCHFHDDNDVNAINKDDNDCKTDNDNHNNDVTLMTMTSL